MKPLFLVLSFGEGVNGRLPLSFADLEEGIPSIIYGENVFILGIGNNGSFLVKRRLGILRLEEFRLTVNCFWLIFRINSRIVPQILIRSLFCREIEAAVAGESSVLVFSLACRVKRGWRCVLRARPVPELRAVFIISCRGSEHKMLALNLIWLLGAHRNVPSSVEWAGVLSRLCHVLVALRGTWGGEDVAHRALVLGLGT